MFEEFVLRTLKKGIISGYSWHVENPKRVVCIIHGIGEYGGRYDRVATAFAKAGIATLSMDLRGHGKSVNAKGHCWPRMDVLEDIDLLLEYAKKKYPDADIVIYGHSMGGNITLDYRFRGNRNYLPSKYIVSAPWINLVNPISPGVYAFGKVAGAVIPSITVGSKVDEATLGHPDSVKPYRTNPMVHNKISLGCAIEGVDIGKALEEGTLENNGRADNIPMLMMHGTADKICHIDGSRAVYRNLKEKEAPVEIIEWQGLFHEIHNGNDVTRGDEVISKAISFILE